MCVFGVVRCAEHKYIYLLVSMEGPTTRKIWLIRFCFLFIFSCRSFASCWKNNNAESKKKKIKLTKVTDTNDNPPSFSKAAYSFDVPENAARGYQVGIIAAIDPDQGANADISYAVISDWANDVFSLNPQTGVVGLSSRLDYEEVIFILDPILLNYQITRCSILWITHRSYSVHTLLKIWGVRSFFVSGSTLHSRCASTRQRSSKPFDNNYRLLQCARFERQQSGVRSDELFQWNIGKCHRRHRCDDCQRNRHRFR